MDRAPRYAPAARADAVIFWARRVRALPFGEYAMPGRQPSARLAAARVPASQGGFFEQVKLMPMFWLCGLPRLSGHRVHGFGMAADPPYLSFQPSRENTTIPHGARHIRPDTSPPPPLIDPTARTPRRHCTPGGPTWPPGWAVADPGRRREARRARPPCRHL